MEKNNPAVEDLIKELEYLRDKVVKIESLHTERKLLEKSLRFKNRLQRLITTISSKFISIQPHEIDYWINRALRILAVFAEADRCLVFQLYDDGKLMDLTHEYYDRDLYSLSDSAVGIEVYKYKYFLTELEKNQQLVLINKLQLPEEAKAEKQLLENLNIRSLILVPLIVRGMLIGYIGLGTSLHETIWTKEIVVLLKIVGEILVNALVRKRAEERLKQYHLIVTNANEHMAIIDKYFTYQSVNRALLRAFDKTELEMTGEKLYDFFPEEVFEKYQKPNIEKCLSGEKVNYQCWFHFPVTGRIYMDVLCDPLWDIDGNIIGIVETSRDITMQKLAEDQLVTAKDKAEQSDKLKTEFLAQISHEIRTPINSMLTFSSMIEEETANMLDEDLKKSFRIIGKAGKRIIRTTDLILDMSEIQAGIYESEFEEFDLYELLDDIYMEYAAMAKEKKLEFKILCDEVIINVCRDKYSLAQMFRNIIHNALTYTFEGFVKILIRRNELDELIVEIYDTGIGISKEYLLNIFEPFTQEDQGFTRRFEGSGLGLALAKKYAELNNATIEIESEKQKGSLFRIRFLN